MARTLAFLGPSGTYTEEAALLYDPEAELRPFPNITAVGMAVAIGRDPEGVVPIENSIEGSVNFTLDLLVSEGSLLIRNEMVLPIEHYLMGKPGTRMEEIEVIFSHPQALAQCREYLESRFLPAPNGSASLSTAQAVGDAMASGMCRPPPSPHGVPRSCTAPRFSTPESGCGGQRHPFRGAGQGRSPSDPAGNDKTSLFSHLTRTRPDSFTR